MAKHEKLIRAKCNRCHRDTKHRILITRSYAGPQIFHPVDEDRVLGSSFFDYDLLECCGCESITLKESVYIRLKGLGESEKEVNYYPPRVSRRIPDWLYRLPGHQRSLLDEIYAALHTGSSRLAIMGARTVVDTVILEKVGDVGTFGQKLTELERQGFVTRAQRDQLAAALEMGHAAAHRGHVADADNVKRVMDIVEHLLQAVYVIGEDAEKLKQVAPPRQRKAQK